MSTNTKADADISADSIIASREKLGDKLADVITQNEIKFTNFLIYNVSRVDVVEMIIGHCKILGYNLETPTSKTVLEYPGSKQAIFAHKTSDKIASVSFNESESGDGVRLIIMSQSN